VVTGDASVCPSCNEPLDGALAATQQLPAKDKPTEGSGKFRSTSSSDSLDGSRFVPGELLGERYRVIDLLGRGGMGEVYRAEDLTLKQIVALKFLPEEFLKENIVIERFRQEVRITRQIAHPNVCRVYDIGKVGGRHFLSMEFIKGEELASAIKRFGRLPSDKAIEISRQICAGLAAAHKLGVIHRDLKPSNVMIDEDGNARITDFGLAALAEDVKTDKIHSGTPAYMSPEQLAGRELTIKSDIYSLGLVLYEIFTGRRAFEAQSLPELLRLRRSDTTPTSPSSIVRNLDPVVERVILRCLDKDPDRRPESALAVAAALPGGDPLAAALAMGETPSPEMVAAAPKEGTLKPTVAAACLAGILIGLVLIAGYSDRVKLFRQVPMNKSPELLEDRARQIVRGFGYTEVSDSLMGIYLDDGYLRYIEENDKSATRWERLKAGQPAVERFWYRESPESLVPLSEWQVERDDPPMKISGMTRTIVDTEGRLISFEAVPPQTDQSDQQSVEPDWAALLAAAALDSVRFASVEPRVIPPHHNDARAAWDGTLAAAPDVPVHIEAAAYRGRPVYFALFFPWDEPIRGMGEWAQRPPRVIAAVMVILFFFLPLTAGIFLARRNYRLGLGDYKGGLRLTVAILLLETVHWVLAAHHVADFGEVSNFGTGMARAVFLAALIWVVYIALEPVVRRRWPHRIISWSRLLAGDLRDPLVSRDILFGSLLGIGITLTSYISRIAPIVFGLPESRPGTINGPTLLNFKEYFHGLLSESVGIGVILGFGGLFLLTIIFIVVRRNWLAAILGWTIFPALIVTPDQYFWLDLFFTGVASALMVYGLMRFGLVAGIMMFLVFSWTNAMPMTLDFSAWYGAYSAVTMIVITALAFYAYRNAIAGQSLFRGNLIPE
jgi:serine/threonine-protein kinase